MTDPLSRYLKTPEAARVLGLSPRTLEKHRSCGTGPAYLKVGGAVRYSLVDLEAWAEAGRQTSTREAPVGPANRDPDRNVR